MPCKAQVQDIPEQLVCSIGELKNTVSGCESKVSTKERAKPLQALI